MKHTMIGFHLHFDDIPFHQLNISTILSHQKDKKLIHLGYISSLLKNFAYNNQFA